MNTISFQGAHKSAKQLLKKNPAGQKGHHQVGKPATQLDQDTFSPSKSKAVQKPTKR